jgi:hypothetical protein
MLDESLEKTLYVNLSCMHEFNSEFSVLDKIAGLAPNYPFNLPGHLYDFVTGKYNQLINNYKLKKLNKTNETNKTDTDVFLDGLIAQAGIDPSKKDQMKEAWNSLIGFGGETPRCCFFISQKQSTNEKFRRLIDYAKKNKFSSIHFISNTNELHVEKILNYLVDEKLIKSYSKKEDSLDIEILLPDDSSIKIYLAASYNYGTYKTEKDNINVSEIPSTTPALLKTLHDRSKEKQASLMSQFPKDSEEGRKMGMEIIFLHEVFSRVKTSAQLADANEKSPLIPHQ